MQPLGAKLFSWETDLEDRAVLEFSYVIDAEPEFSAVVELEVHVRDGQGIRRVFSERRDGAGGDYGRWHRASVELRDLRGDVTIDFVSSASASGFGPDGTRIARLFLGCPRILVPRGKGPARPNLLLISLDTLRADRMGIYGYARRTTPRLDRLAQGEGVVIENAVAPASKTLPSHATMLTGMEAALAVDGWNDPKFGRLGKFPTLAEILRDYGYRTLAVTEDGYVSDPLFGFGRGFDVFVERKGTRENPHNAGTIDRTLEIALERIEDARGAPFFAFVHSYQVHAPYRPAPLYRRLFPSPSDASLQRLDSDLYDAEIAQTDAALHSFLERLRDNGTLEDTIVVITSDHGEEFGEHGGRFHGAHLYSEILHVPLIFVAPAILPAGKRLSSPFGLIDLVPTLLDLIGVPIPPHVQGHSRANSLRSLEQWPPDDIVSIGVTDVATTYARPDSSWRSPALAVTSWPYRLIRYQDADAGVRYELYDLVADPDERANRFSAPIQGEERRLERLRRLLDNFARERDALREKLLARVVEVGTQAEAPPNADARHLEELRALGYAH